MVVLDIDSTIVIAHSDKEGGAATYKHSYVRQRGHGLARAVAPAAVADVLANQLLPQWWARRDSSRRVARALEFHQLCA